MHVKEHHTPLDPIVHPGTICSSEKYPSIHMNNQTRPLSSVGGGHRVLGGGSLVCLNAQLLWAMIGKSVKGPHILCQSHSTNYFK